ncbi:MAG TPA: hypothetical protein VNG33_18230 [Polyangiaceae bacterium]|nr:hypothetical protein [Polyangiaceae bacterium]
MQLGRRQQQWWLTGAVIWMGACGTSSTPTRGGVGVNGEDTVRLPDGAFIQVAEGAVPGGVTVQASIVKQKVAEPPAGLQLVGPVYAFTPHGTQFATPSHIQLPERGGGRVYTLDDEDDPSWEAVPKVTLASHHFDFDVTHISLFAELAESPAPGSAGAGGGGPGEAGAGGGGPGEAGASGLGGESAGAGGESSTMTTDGWLSGSRLRAVLEVSGGATLFKHWHDTTIDMDCDFMLDMNGVERCLPTKLCPNHSLARCDNDYWSAFGDSNCEEPVVIYDPSIFTPKYATEAGYEFGCARPRFVTVGAEVKVTGVFVKTPYGCELDGTVEPNKVAARAGAIVPETTFVAAVETVREPRDARLAANVRVASDGSRQVTSQFDLQRQVDCGPQLHQGDGYACVPTARAYFEGKFSDMDCKSKAVFVTGSAQSCFATPKIVQVQGDSNTDTYFEVGTKAVAGQLFELVGATCTGHDQPVSPLGSYFELGSAVPFTDFPPLSSKNEGTGRILVNVTRGSSGELVSREEFHDPVHNWACYAQFAADGNVRCLPDTPYLINMFVDSKCSQALFGDDPRNPAPPAGTPVVTLDPSGRASVFVLGAKVPPPAMNWYSDSAGNCLSASVPNTLVYVATTAIAASDMPPVTTTIE